MILYVLRPMTPGLSPRRKAKKPSENREKLIAVAREQMATHGFAGTSTEAIVRSAGITRGALYYQFVDKRDLFRAVCQSVVTDLTLRVWAETMAEAQHEADELRIGFLKLLDLCAEPSVRQILLVDGPAVLGMEEWRNLQAPSTLGLLRHALGHLVEANRLSAEQLEPLAHLLFGAMMQGAAALGSDMDPEHSRRVYRESFEVLLHGLEKR